MAGARVAGWIRYVPVDSVNRRCRYLLFTSSLRWLPTRDNEHVIPTRLAGWKRKRNSHLSRGHHTCPIINHARISWEGALVGTDPRSLQSGSVDSYKDLSRPSRLPPPPSLARPSLLPRETPHHTNPLTLFAQPEPLPCLHQPIDEDLLARLIDCPPSINISSALPCPSGIHTLSSSIGV